MSDNLPQLSEAESAPLAAPRPAANSAPPLCLVVDEESSVRQFISLILHGLGIETIELADGAALRAVKAPRAPNLIIHSVSLDSVDAIESLLRLSQCNYGGPVLLTSRRGAAVLEHVNKVGRENKLKMLAPLKKPFGADAIVEIMHRLKLGLSLAQAGQINLDEAMAQNWIEFWYQPMINLRRKRLVGAEMFARVRHPEAGIILPAGFMAEAAPASIFKLSEMAVANALKVGSSYMKLGISLPMTVNIPIEVLEKLPLEKLVLDQYSHALNWPGLIVDIAEEQIIAYLGLATELSKKLARINIKIAVDNFGKGYEALAQLKELPFAQIKLDRAFIANCGTDNVNAPLCKSMIELAHKFGQMAVANGIESAGDALALVSMNCDIGQGYLLGHPMPESHFVSLLRQRTAKKKERKPATAAT